MSDASDEALGGTNLWEKSGVHRMSERPDLDQITARLFEFAHRWENRDPAFHALGRDAAQAIGSLREQLAESEGRWRNAVGQRARLREQLAEVQRHRIVPESEVLEEAHTQIEHLREQLAESERELANFRGATPVIGRELDELYARIKQLEDALMQDGYPLVHITALETRIKQMEEALRFAVADAVAGSLAMPHSAEFFDAEVQRRIEVYIGNVALSPSDTEEEA